MITMAPTRPSELHARRVRLTAELAAVAEARGQVRAALRPRPARPRTSLSLASPIHPKAPAWPACAPVRTTARTPPVMRVRFPAASNRGRAWLPATALALAAGTISSQGADHDSS